MQTAHSEAGRVELWRGDDIILFNDLQEGLQAAGIPFQVEGGEGNWRTPFLLGLSSHLGGHLAVSVHSANLPGGRETLRKALEKLPRKCLLDELEDQEERELLPENALICPLCESTAEEGAQCSLCGIPLVSGAKFNASVLSEHAWQGEHPGAFAEVLESFRRREIPYCAKGQGFEGKIGQPCCNFPLCIQVLSGDAERAFREVEQLSAHWQVYENADLGIRGAIRRSLEASEQDNFDWPRGERGILVWDGPVREIARMLRACLRENEISSRVEKHSAKGYQVFVLGRDSGRAEEIVREVMQATPPE